MAYSPRRGRYDYSPSPPPRYRSRSRSPLRPRIEEQAYNPGNNLYVTGLSTRVTEKELEDHFSREGKVLECHLVVDPRTKESRGFGFVTMDSLEDAERCIKYLDKSIFEGRVITVEKCYTASAHIEARRKRARTPTPGKYLGVKTTRGTSSYGDRRRGYGDGYSRRSPRYSPYRSERDYSPQYSPYRSSSRYRDRSVSPPYSPYGSPSRSYRSRYRSRSRSLSPYGYR